MKTLFAAAFLQSRLLVSAPSATPVAPSSAGSNIIHVAQGCGPASRAAEGRLPPDARLCPSCASVPLLGSGRRVCRTWW